MLRLLPFSSLILNYSIPSDTGLSSRSVGAAAGVSGWSELGAFQLFGIFFFLVLVSSFLDFGADIFIQDLARLNQVFYFIQDFRPAWVRCCLLAWRSFNFGLVLLFGQDCSS